MVTPIYFTGFEYGLATLSGNGGGLANSVSGTPDIQSTVKRTGTYSMRINPSATTEYYSVTVTGSPTCIVGRLYIRCESDPTGTRAYVFYGNAAAGMDPVISIGTDGLIEAGFSGGSYVDGPTLAHDGTWYRIDFRMDVSANPNTIDWQVDGVAQTQATAAQAATTFSEFSPGTKNSTTCDYYLDDLLVSATSGDYPIGAGGIVGLRPSGDGTHNNAANIMEDSAGNDIDGSTYYAYDKLDEDPWTSGATSDYVRQTGNGTGNYCEILFADTTQTSIQGAVALLEYASASATANTGGCIIIDEDTTETTLWGKAGALADYSESSAFYKRALLPTPAGGWDQAAVNALKCRFGYSDDANPDPYWLAIMVEVAYAPAGTLNYQSVSGALTSAGTVAKVAGKAVAGALTSAGTVAKLAARGLSGALTSAGTVAKQAARGVSGALTSSGAVATVRIYARALSGALTSAGTLAGRANKAVGGGLTTAGSLARQAGKALAGGLTSAGIVAKLAAKPLAGALTSSGTVAAVRIILQAVSGALTTTGALAKQGAKVLGGALASAGTLTKQAGKPLMGGLATAGALVQRANKSVSGALTSAGIVVKRAGKGLAGALTTSGAVEAIKSGAQIFYQACAGALTTAGSLARQAGKGLAGTLTLAGAVTWRITNAVAVTIRAALDLVARLRAGEEQLPGARAGDEVVPTIRGGKEL